MIRDAVGAVVRSAGFVRWSGGWRLDRRTGRAERRFVHRELDGPPLFGLGLLRSVVVVEARTGRTWVVSSPLNDWLCSALSRPLRISGPLDELRRIQSVSVG